MLDKNETIEKLRSTQQYLGEHYGVHSMMLFGSLAKGQQHEGCDVDVAQLRENMNPVFKQQIVKYGIRVY